VTIHLSPPHILINGWGILKMVAGDRKPSSVAAMFPSKKLFFSMSFIDIVMIEKIAVSISNVLRQFNPIC